MNSTTEEFATLTDEQKTTLFNGLVEAGLYQAFEDKIMKRVRENSEARRLAEEATKTEEQKFADREIRAPYIETLKLVFKFDPVSGWSEWGFVIFRATAYGPEADAQWAEFRRRWDQIIEEGHQRGFHPKSDRAIELLRFRWVEDPLLAGASPMEVSQ
jgi:hypothetical protein